MGNSFRKVLELKVPCYLKDQHVLYSAHTGDLSEPKSLIWF